MEKKSSDSAAWVGALAVAALFALVGVVGTGAAWRLLGREGSPSAGDRVDFLVLWILAGLASRAFAGIKSSGGREK